MTDASRKQLGRREVLTTTVAIGAVAVTAWLPGSAVAAAEDSRADQRLRMLVPEGERFELLGEAVRAGTRVPYGTIEAVLPVAHGAVPVVLRTREGERFQVDILRRDPRGPTGVAETTHLSIFIVNHGNGDAPSVADQVHAARGLAAWLTAHDVCGPDLLSHRERIHGHPEGVFSLWP